MFEGWKCCVKLDGDAEPVLLLGRDQLIHDGRPADGFEIAIADVENMMEKRGHLALFRQARQKKHKAHEPEKKKHGKQRIDNVRQSPHARH